MATSKSEVEKIVARVRRVWGNESVEYGNKRGGWLYRVTTPTGERVQLHSSPSDRNWKHVVMRALNNAGFEAAEQTYLEEEAKVKAAQAEDMRRKEAEDLEKAQIRASALARAAGPFGPQVADVGWIWSKHEVPAPARRVFVTPELAKKILAELNTNNRPLRPGRVLYWAKIMRADRWRFTHQGIAFDNRGALQDGQHRLAAAVQEDFTLDVQINVGMPTENFADIDTGAGRTGGDTVAVDNNEFPFPNILAASGKLVLVYDRFGSEARNGARSRIPNDELNEAIHKYGVELEEYVIQAKQISGKRGVGPKMSPNALAAGIYLIARKLPRNDARVVEFIRGYAEGSELPSGDARVALRSFMSNLRDANRKVSVQ